MTGCSASNRYFFFLCKDSHQPAGASLPPAPLHAPPPRPRPCERWILNGKRARISISLPRDSTSCCSAPYMDVRLFSSPLAAAASDGWKDRGEKKRGRETGWMEGGVAVNTSATATSKTREPRLQAALATPPPHSPCPPSCSHFSCFSSFSLIPLFLLFFSPIFSTFHSSCPPPPPFHPSSSTASQTLFSARPGAQDSNIRSSGS